MRALLIVNPFATSTTDAGRRALANALSAQLELTVELTTHRGHAGEIAARARAERCPVVFVHGGDGTVNEVVNGLLDPPGVTVGPDSPPALAVIPGGSANVFARSLGVRADPLEATGQLLRLLADGERRRISLGHADGRWFLFNSGLGVDAEVVHSIELQRRAGKPATDARYLWTTTKAFLAATRRRPELTVELPGRQPGDPVRVIDGVHFAFVCNANPWTYLGERPVLTNPDTTYRSRLGIFASQSMSVPRNIRLFTQLLTNRPPRAGHLTTDDDVGSVRIRANIPVDMQMDGDYLGTRVDVRFGCVADRLEVVAPSA